MHALDEIRTGAYRYLFHPDTLISGKEDAGSNFARGYNLLGHDLIDRTMDAIRRVSEQCRNLRGFLIFRAIGGGTGSGFGTLLLEKLADAYGRKTTKAEFLVFPSPSWEKKETFYYLKTKLTATYRIADFRLLLLNPIMPCWPHTIRWTMWMCPSLWITKLCMKSAIRSLVFQRPHIPIWTVL